MLSAQSYLRHLVPKYDHFVTPTHYVTRLELPGFKKEDIEVFVDNGKIYVEAKREKPDFDKYSNFESTRNYEDIKVFSSFERDANLEKIESLLADGILTIKAPKTPKNKIDVKIQ